MENKTAEILEAVHTHNSITNKERRYAYYLSLSPFLLQTFCKGGYNLGGALNE